jgi:hypothetical protein
VRKAIITVMLTVPTLIGYGQYSSASLKLGLLKPELDGIELPRYYQAGIDYRTFLASFGTDNLAIDLGFGVSINSIYSRESFTTSFTDVSQELLYSSQNENELDYSGELKSSYFLSINSLQVGPTINFKLHPKFRISAFYGLGIGTTYVGSKSQYANGSYSGSGNVNNISDELNSSNTQGYFYLIDNRDLPNFKLTTIEKVKNSQLYSFTRNSNFEIGLEYDLTETISLGLCMGFFSTYAGNLVRQGATKLKGSTLSYQSQGDTPSINGAEKFSKALSPEDGANDNFKWFEPGKPEKLGNSQLIKLTIYL